MFHDAEIPDDPSHLRDIFGQNLRLLLQAAPSIRQVCMDINVHRSQFNRYLNAEAFPKPDVLHRICLYFKVDARVLLEPLNRPAPESRYGNARKVIAMHPEVSDYLQILSRPVDTGIMPTGFYRFIRRSYVYPDKFQAGLNMVYSKEGHVFVKGFMSRSIARELNIPVNSGIDRVFKGPLLALDGGVCFLATHKGARSFTLNYLEHRSIGSKLILAGYCARTAAITPHMSPVSPIVFELIRLDPGAILNVARKSGFIDTCDIPVYLRDFLQDI